MVTMVAHGAWLGNTVTYWPYTVSSTKDQIFGPFEVYYMFFELTI